MAAPQPTPLQRIRQIMPELPVSSVRVGEDGLVNDVLIVNEELVFRFARGEDGRRALEREARLLALVRRHVSISVPELVRQSPDCLVYRFIRGVPLSRHDLLAMDREARTALVEQVGIFLHELHGIPVGSAEVSGPFPDAGLSARQECERLYEALEHELMPFMMAWARNWARGHFRPVLEGELDLTHAPTLIHGDVAPYHLFYDPDTRRLTGIIDFGDAGPGDPALDLGSIINAYGESLLWEMESLYPALPDLIDRARFHAGALELRWALAAIRSRDPAWFLCHLGYARDAHPVGWPGKGA